ncbi:recombinase family protein [uncultured Trichococcus sp.]
MYLQGIGSFKIAAKLNVEEIQTITGKNWQGTTIRRRM